MQLVYLENAKKQPYTTHRIIAECGEVSDITVRKLIDVHKAELERFGILSFEMTKITDGRGRPEKIYHLNEQQATLLITFMRNTEAVTRFKTELVKQFFEMRDEVANFYKQRTLEKAKRKSLNEAIEEWKQAPKHAYATINNLLLKGASGMNKKQLMEQRGGLNGVDSLTSAELVKFQQLENMVIAMMQLGLFYDDIKAMVTRSTKKAMYSSRQTEVHG